MGTRQVVLLTPPRSSHLRPLLSRQHSAPISPLAAILMNLPASVANKELTRSLSPLAATLTRNGGWGVLWLTNFLHALTGEKCICKSLVFYSLRTLPSSVLRARTKDAQPESANGGGVEGLLSGLALGSLLARSWLALFTLCTKSVSQPFCNQALPYSF